MKLYLNSATDYSITDEHGMVFTVKEAQSSWEDGKVEDWNLAFARLIAFGFNLEEVQKHYRKGGRK